MNKGLMHDFKSSIFKNIFLSYIVIIIFSFIMYGFMNIRATTRLNNNEILESYRLKLREVASSMDMQFIAGQQMSNSINGSNNINKIYLHTVSLDNPLDAYTLYQALSEIKTIKRFSHNINIEEVMIFFDNYNRVYTSSQIMVLKNEFTMREALNRRFTKDTMNQLLGTSNMEIVFNKEYLIYTMPYRYTSSNNDKGMICVLYDGNRLLKKMEQIVGEGAKINIYYEEKLLLGDGIEGEHILELTSMVNNKVIYKMSIYSQSLKGNFKSIFSMTLILGFINTLFYIILAFLFANRYYTPIKNIEEAIGGTCYERGKGKMEYLVNNIKKIIGECRGYEDRISDIIPYAEQGILHHMINGSMESEHMKDLYHEDTMVLKYLYFMIAVINISPISNRAKDTKKKYEEFQEFIQKTCEKYQDKETIIVMYHYDMENIFLIINSNFCEDFETLIYNIHRELVQHLQHEEYEITIGLDEVKENIEEISDSCRNALKALDGMIGGGRGAVYFYESEIEGKNGEYYFPKDMSKKLIKALKENNLSDIQILWKVLYTKNISEQEISSEDLRTLLDELYMTLLKSIKEIKKIYTLPIHIEKINKRATFEETLSYYYKQLEGINKSLLEVGASKKDRDQKEKKVIQYINTHYKEVDMSLAHMTEQFGMSSKAISQACKNICGMSYLQYIQELRIRYAAELIKSTDATLEHIAMQCGYTNILTFRRNFKTVMGTTPSDYREEER